MKSWGKVHRPLENVLVKLFTYVADDVDGDLIMCQRKGAPHAAMEKQQLLGNTHGKQRTLEGREYAKIIYNPCLKPTSL